MPSTSRHSVRRKALRELLHRDDLAGIEKIPAGEARGYLRAAVSLLHHEDPVMARRAAEAVGKLAGAASRKELEPARECVRRLVWSMNDESGSCIPLAPDAIGAILMHVPELIDEFEQVLASFADTDPFREGVAEALRKVAKARGDG
jgi:hypothetical protein